MIVFLILAMTFATCYTDNNGDVVLDPDGSKQREQQRKWDKRYECQNLLIVYSKVKCDDPSADSSSFCKNWFSFMAACQ